MTLQERLNTLHAKAARLYLQRQQIQANVNHWQRQAAEADQDLLRSDGEIALVESMIAEASPKEGA